MALVVKALRTMELLAPLSVPQLTRLAEALRIVSRAAAACICVRVRTRARVQAIRRMCMCMWMCLSGSRGGGGGVHPARPRRGGRLLAVNSTEP